MLVAFRPRQPIDLDALVDQFFVLVIAGFAVNAAFLCLAIMNLSRFLRKLVADIVTLLLDLLAYLLNHLARHPGHRCFAVGGNLALLFIASGGGNPGRHQRLFDMRTAARSACNGPGGQLIGAAFAVVEPTVEPRRTICAMQGISDHGPIPAIMARVNYQMYS